jgi:predicted RNA-binding protein YlqC (UPF0109 family)
MNNSIDQQFVEYIVKSLVSNPDEVKIERRIDEKGVLLELSVAPEDLGRVIGKRGATAQSLRTLLRALGTKQDARYNLKIVDTSDGYTPEPRAPRAQDDRDDSSQSDDDATLPADEDEAVEDEAVQVEEEHHEDEEASDRISRTRKELAELDDLDV